MPARTGGSGGAIAPPKFLDSSTQPFVQPHQTVCQFKCNSPSNVQYLPTGLLGAQMRTLAHQVPSPLYNIKCTQSNSTKCLNLGVKGREISENIWMQQSFSKYKVQISPCIPLLNACRTQVLVCVKLRQIIIVQNEDCSCQKKDYEKNDIFIFKSNSMTVWPENFR